MPPFSYKGSFLAKRSGEASYQKRYEINSASSKLATQKSGLLLITLGSVSSRECLDAPAILATFTAGRTGLVACPWRHYNFNNYADNPHVDGINFIGSFFLYCLEKKQNAKSFSWNAS